MTDAPAPGHEDLLETLRDAQRLGFFGPRSIDHAVDHARQFVRALAPASPGRVVDLGSGGGLPGLVIAAELFVGARHPVVELVERRGARADFLRRAVARLRWEHVQVRELDAEMLARDVERGVVDPYDAVTARGFGPPAPTLRLARRLITPVGRIVISEPPDGDRWPPELLAELGLESHRAGAVRVFRPKSP